jgi:hypothetical protein
VPPGTPLSLPPHVLAAIEQALRQPAGCASYAVLRQWVQQSHHLEVNDHTLSTIVRTRFNAQLKVPRPRHTKNPEAMPAFQETCREQLQRGMPPENTRPVRVYSQDESRFGLLTVRRRLTACGGQPVGTVPHVCAWLYVYGAGAPTTDARFCRERPYLNTESFQRFVDTFAQACPDRRNLLLLDNSGIHKAQRLMLPSNVRRVFLPPYWPALNPLERLWRDVKDDWAWQQFISVEAQQDDLSQL